jgi:hypothetical protein
MVTFSGPPSAATRNKPIADVLKTVLQTAAQAAGLDAVTITSGGQDALGEGTRRTGSTRHDRGRAADLQCIVNGRAVTFTDQAADPTILAFVKAAAAAGATGIGAGVTYMGNKTLHIGFGTSINDRTKLTWGAQGAAANAPRWLRQAAEAGWAAPDAPLAGGAGLAISPGRCVVIARDGLRLRGGPGTEFESERTLPLGTALNVIDVRSPPPGWARVDLEGDGLLDGYVFAAFLAPAGPDSDNENAPEPDNG